MKKITSKLLLRIAAIIVLLHALGHTVGFSNWQKPGGTVPEEVIQKMQDTHFPVQGRDTTMANSFSGFGYTTSVFLALIVCLLWLLSSRGDKNQSVLLTAIGSALALLALDEFIFFFPAVAVLSLAASVLVFVSSYKMGKTAGV